MPRVSDIRMLSKREQRWVFSERNPKYLALCGLIHVKHLAIAFAVIEGMIVTVAVVRELIHIQKSIWTFVLGFFWFISIASDAFVIAGALRSRCAYLLPYMSVSFLFSAGVIMKLFIDFLDTANTKDTLELHRLYTFFLESLTIVLGVYSIIVVWHLFNYIADLKMDNEIRKSEQKMLEERMENVKEPPFLVAFPDGLKFD